jgi:hypothetical protein
MQRIDARTDLAFQLGYLAGLTTEGFDDLYGEVVRLASALAADGGLGGPR